MTECLCVLNLISRLGRTPSSSTVVQCQQRDNSGNQLPDGLLHPPKTVKGATPFELNAETLRPSTSLGFRKPWQGHPSVEGPTMPPLVQCSMWEDGTAGSSAWRLNPSLAVKQNAFLLPGE